MKIISNYAKNSAMKKVIILISLIFFSLPAYSLDWERAPDSSWVRVTWFGTPKWDIYTVLNPSDEGIRSGDGSLIIKFKEHNGRDYRFDFMNLTCKNRQDFDKWVQSRLTNLNIPESEKSSHAVPGEIDAYCATKTIDNTSVDLNATIFKRTWYFDSDPPVTNTCNLKVGGPYDLNMGKNSSTQISGEYSISCNLESTVAIEFKNSGEIVNFPDGLSGKAKMENGTAKETVKNVTGQITRPFTMELTSTANATPGSYSGTVVVVATPQ